MGFRRPLRHSDTARSWRIVTTAASSTSAAPTVIKKLRGVLYDQPQMVAGAAASGFIAAPDVRERRIGYRADDA